MEPKYIITQVMGTIAAVLAVRWGWNEFRRDWHENHRLPLVTGPYMGGRTVLLALGWVAALVPFFIAIGKLGLLPSKFPAFFFTTLAWTGIGSVFILLGMSARQARQFAKGWLTVVGPDTILVDAEGGAATLKLGPGSARLRFIASGGAAQYVQLDLDDGRTRAHVWGMVGFRALKLVRKEYVPEAQGLMLTGSMGHLCRWLAPYLAKD